MGDTMEKELRMFPEIREVTGSPADRNERYAYQCPIVMKYLKNKLNGWNIGVFLQEIRVKKVALYAVTEFTEYVVRDLESFKNLKIKEATIDIVCICDRNYSKYKMGFHGCDVIGVDELTDAYKANKIDKILICSVFHVNEIFQDLMHRGVPLEDLISVTSAIFSD